MSSTLQLVQRLAWNQYYHDGGRYELDLYLDAGHEALCRCLARFDPTRGVPFRSYARPRILGAMQDARLTYLEWWFPGYRQSVPHADALRPHTPPVAASLTWEALLARLSGRLRLYAQRCLWGYTDAEQAALFGVTPGALSLFLTVARRRLRLRVTDYGF